MNRRKTMNDQEIFARYIELLDNSNEVKTKLNKTEYLFSKGLYRLVECEADDPEGKFDPKDDKYWKRVPIEVSDDQFDLLLEADRSPKKTDFSRSNLPKVIGVVIVFISIIGTLMLSAIASEQIFIALGIGFSAALYGVFFIVLGNMMDSINGIHEYLSDRFK
jgi:hypothetical protein